MGASELVVREWHDRRCLSPSLLVAGGIFAFDAPFKGSLGNVKLNKPIVGMVRYGDGYLMVGADGGIFTFSSLPFSGSLGDKPPASPVVAVAALP